MKRIVVILAALIPSLIMSTPAFAGEGASCHFHGNRAAEESTVILCAKDRRDLYVEQGTTEASWSDVEPKSVEIIEGTKGQEWRVLFENKAVSEPSKRTLYMFFTLPGNFIAANYSGK